MMDVVLGVFFVLFCLALLSLQMLSALITHSSTVAVFNILFVPDKAMNTYRTLPCAEYAMHAIISCLRRFARMCIKPNYSARDVTKS